MEPTIIAIDLATRVFQIHFVDSDTGAIHTKALKRAQLLPFFANRPVSRVVMEACGSAHHWARQLARLGHDVRLIAAQFVRPFVKSNKNDAADAAAIWEAAQRPGMRFVAVKTEDQQAMRALHRMRQQLVRFRVMQVNQMRGLLYEFGVILPQGRRAAIEAAKVALATLADQLPAMLTESLQDQLSRMLVLDEQIGRIEQRIIEWRRSDEACLRISEIPGVGLLTATAAVSVIGQAKNFRSGREFAAYLGLVPRQNSSGGKIRLGGISKRGDVYLRTLLIHGARAVISSSKHLPERLRLLLTRRPTNVVAVALANKMARTIWALLAYGRTYQATPAQ
ncbi:IS110 family transposase [Paraburkholderia domus]|uniref:IS110 family transposase n=1 Tax=Paraburkholderia domus TaxID=2793075 RepID=UPI001912092A|nr:IS110 family transposase [Paraburkholderia domus]MBK5186245.1 IS110 family transposase [Burkholderia sp. R-69749]CAE6902382.1 IS110 family transposase ISBcen5 [Paraburkholderia domus]